MGTFFPADLPSRFLPHPEVPAAAPVVAGDGCGCQEVCGGLYHLCSKQGLPSGHIGTALEPHRGRLCYFIPLLKLPTASETRELMQHVICLHSISVDIVSDRGPQIVSQVWKAICRALQTTASLSSGYHPQSNGQWLSAVSPPGNPPPGAGCCPGSSMLTTP